jgi:hypothetical protein
LFAARPQGSASFGFVSGPAEPFWFTETAARDKRAAFLARLTFARARDRSPTPGEAVDKSPAPSLKNGDLCSAVPSPHRAWRRLRVRLPGANTPMATLRRQATASRGADHAFGGAVRG